MHYHLKEKTHEALIEDRLHKDYFYAEEELINAQIAGVYEELTKVIQSMESYGWTVNIRYLTNVLRNL